MSARAAAGPTCVGGPGATCDRTCPTFLRNLGGLRPCRACRYGVRLREVLEGRGNPRRVFVRVKPLPAQDGGYLPVLYQRHLEGFEGGSITDRDGAMMAYWYGIRAGARGFATAYGGRYEAPFFVGYSEGLDLFARFNGGVAAPEPYETGVRP